jgi:hypothetical protein
MVSVLLIVAAALIVFPFFISSRRSTVTLSSKIAITRDAVAASLDMPQTPISPEAMARSFAHPAQRIVKSIEPENSSKTEPPPTAAPSVAEWLRPIVMIADEAGIVRLYLKNMRDGRLIRVRQDGIEENGVIMSEAREDQYVISINEVRYIIPRRKK